MPAHSAGARGSLVPKVIFTVLSLATLAVLLVTISNRRKLNAQQTPESRPETSAATTYAQAERAEAQKLEPLPVPDDQNFAATPYFTSLFNKSIDVGASQWPDDFPRANQWPHKIPTLRESPNGRVTGRLQTDLVTWQKTFQEVFNMGDPKTAESILVADPPDPVANAKAALTVLENLKPYDPALNELRRVQHRPHARFPIKYNWDNPWGILLPHLAIVKRTCQLLRLKASAELAAGNSEQGLQDILLMLRLIEAPRTEPTLISHLVRIACIEITFQPIWEGLAQRRWSEAQLKSLQETLQRIDLLRDMEFSLKAEGTWSKLTIALFRDGKISTIAPLLVDENGKTDPWVEEADKALKSAPRDWFDAEQRNVTRLVKDRLLGGFDVDSRRVEPRVILENAHQLERDLHFEQTETLLTNHTVFARAFLPAISAVHRKFAGTQGYTDLAIVACALEQHRLANGKFPDDLAALAPRFLQKVPHDIISGEALHYELQPDGQFLLYSIGWNNIDDHGELAFLASGRGPEKKDGDWVWRYPARK